MNKKKVLISQPMRGLSTEQIKADNPELEAFDTYDELLAAIKKAL